MINSNFTLDFLDWLILKCDYQSHGVFEYQGQEYTNKELLEIYKKYHDFDRAADSNEN
jgi:hypothetical protein